jgi:hypothetical protein
VKNLTELPKNFDQAEQRHRNLLTVSKPKIPQAPQEILLGVLSLLITLSTRRKDMSERREEKLPLVVEKEISSLGEIGYFEIDLREGENYEPRETGA